MTELYSKKKIILSGIQPTGVFTLGNYIGALKNWVKLQEDYNTAYMIADMHSLTVRQDPIKLRQQILTAFAVVLACGVDPKKSLTFIQSHVHQHAQLSWVLSCNTQFGELSRMTQFKDKSAKNTDNINAGLFTYPSLMASDILLYQADLVPVGADQKQHLEITRDIANRFNNIYGETFKIPEPYISKVGARVMSLSNPNKKMSKSDENPNSFITILDKPEVIVKKFKKAVTDSEMKVRYAQGKDGINNLISIYSAVTGLSYAQIEKDFDGKGYGHFKTAVGEAVAEHLRPVRENYQRLIDDKSYLEECYKLGAKNASNIANNTLEKVYRKIGFINK